MKKFNMAGFTNFLNLFKWNPETDSEEEFDIDKALNQNWDKIDKKLEDYISDMDTAQDTFENSINTEIESFKDTVNTNISNFETSTNQSVTALSNKVDGLEESISLTQEMHKYVSTITADTAKGAEVTLPCNYKVRQ